MNIQLSMFYRKPSALERWISGQIGVAVSVTLAKAQTEAMRRQEQHRMEYARKEYESRCGK